MMLKGLPVQQTFELGLEPLPLTSWEKLRRWYMSDIWTLLLGALLAILGGVIGDEVRSARDRSQERNSIKVSIADELTEIEKTISDMHQVWESAQLFHPSFVTDLLSSTSAYDNLRPRLFLIKDKELRKEISNFYKKLKDTAKKTEGKIGTLADTAAASTEQGGFDAAFQAICGEAKVLRSKLD